MNESSKEGNFGFQRTRAVADSLRTEPPELCYARMMNHAMDLESELEGAKRALSDTPDPVHFQRMREAIIRTSGWLESYRDPNTIGEGERQEHIKLLDDALYNKGHHED